MVNGAGVDHENIRDGAGIDTELVSIQSTVGFICIILFIYLSRNIIRNLIVQARYGKKGINPEKIALRTFLGLKFSEKYTE